MPGPDDLAALSPLARTHEDDLRMRVDLAQAADPLAPPDDNLGIPLPDLPEAPARPRNEFDPEGKGPRQGMSFMENVAGSFRSNTIEGALLETIERDSMAKKPTNKAMDQAWLAAAATDPSLVGVVSSADPWNTIVPPAQAVADKEAALEDAYYAQLAYDLNPTRITAAGVAGSAVGALMAPSNLLTAGRALSAAGLGARPVARAAIDSALMAGATDAATQGIRTGSGAQEEFEVDRALLAPMVGGAAGGALAAVTPLAVAGARKALTAATETYRDIRGLGSAAVRPASAPEAAGRAIEAPASGQAPTAAQEAPEAREAAIRADATDRVQRDLGLSRVEAERAVAAATTPDQTAPADLPPIPEGGRFVETGRFGPVIEGLRGKWSDAVDWLRSAGSGDARGVLEHPDVPASIDVIWGTRKGGLQHIIQDHPDVVADLPERLAAMSAVSKSANRIVLENDAARAVVRTTYDGDGKHWLLTAYTLKNERQRTGGRTESPGALEAGSSPTSLPDQPIPERPPVGEPVPRLDDHRVATSDGKSIDVRFSVVEARDLRTSSDAGYDAGLQPRQRDRAASQEQIRSIASDLEPERLGFSSEADRGAPIVGADGMVESGNGRIEAIRRAYEQGGEPAQRYRQWLADKGVDVSGYDAPVLVRERVTPMTPEERQAFTVSANRSSTLALSASEQALADARGITNDALDLIRNVNDLGAVANRDFVRSFASSLPQVERGAMTTAEGGLSAAGLTRVRNAVLAKAYGDAPVLARITEATADDVKSISNALVAAAPDWARLRGDLDAGLVRADVDLRPELLEAVSRTADLRAKGVRLDTFLSQQDAFDALHPDVEGFMRMFYDPSGRRAAGGPRIAEALRTYAIEARKVSADGGLDLGLAPVTARDLQRVAAERGGASADESAATLFRRVPRDGANDAARRAEVRRSGTDGDGRGAGGEGEAVDRGRSAGTRAAELDAEQHFQAEAKAIGEELFRKKSIASPHGDEIAEGRPLVDQGTVPGDTRVGRLEDLARQITTDFQTIMRTGRVAAGAQGTYNTRSGVIRVRTLSDLDTVFHEVGHDLHLHPSTKADFDPVVTGNRGELAPVGAGQGAEGDAEAFAELFRLYVTNKAFAAKTYPKATAALEAALSTKLPEQAAAVERMRASLDALHRADSGALVSADVVTPAPDGLFSRILDSLGLRSVGGADIDPLGRPVYQWKDALYTRFIDPKNPIAQAMEGLARIHKDNTGKTLNLLPMDDAYIRARLSSGSNAIADSILMHGVVPASGVDPVGPSFFNAITTAIGKRWTQAQWHDFGAYLVARRMVAEYPRFLAGDIPNPPGKFSQADYVRAVGDFETANPNFAAGAAQLYEFQTNLLQRRFDKHLFTKTYVDAALSRQDYVPLLRDMTDLGSAQMANTRSGSGGASLMKAFRGSQRSPLNPLDMIYKSVHDLEFEIAANDTKRALAQMADMAGPGSGAIAERIPANRMTASQVDVLDALKAAGNRSNIDPTDLGALMQHAEMILGDDAFAKYFRQEAIRPGQEPITFYFEGGERRALRLADGRFGEELLQALNPLTAVEKNIFVATFQIAQGILRSGVTKSVGFIYRNLVRDQLTSFGTGGRRYIPFLSAIRGGLDIVLKGGDFERYISFGGLAGGAINDAIESSGFGRNAQAFRERSALNPVRYGKNLVKAIEISEASTRAGLFRTYVKQARGLGYDELNAVLYATFKSNDYIDFRKAGSMMTGMRRYIPFLNAAVQGTDREYRALIGDMVRLERKRLRQELTTAEADRLKDARIAWVRVLGQGIVLGGGVAYLNADKPEWSKAAEFRRTGSYNLFSIGDGLWVTMPKPFGFVRNVSDLFEYAVEYAKRRDPAIPGNLLGAIGESHHLPYTNPLIDIFYNTRANYDPFRKRPVVPTYLQGVEPAEQYNAATSEVAKMIGSVTNWSPMKIDYVVKSLGAGTAQDFLMASDALFRKKGREKTMWELPLMREMAKNLLFGNEINTAFWDQVRLRTGSLAQAADTYKAKINAGERVGAAEYLKGLSEDRRTWAVLMAQGFDTSKKMTHPLFAAQAHAEIISGITRQLVNDNLIRESDVERGNTTLSRRDAKPIKVDGPTREKVMSELSSLSTVYARNALLATNAPGMVGIDPADPNVQLDRIKMLSRPVYDELTARIGAKRIPDLDVVKDRWPEVRARLLKDGEKAELGDLATKRPRAKTKSRRSEAEPAPAQE